jgi:two-component system, OmpR family, response regulator
MALNAGGHHDSTIVNCSDIDRSVRSPFVLVIEADRDLMRTMTDYLNEQDMLVIPAFSRQDAMKRLVECSPDVVILDLQLGNEDGFDLLRDIRDRSAVPVILLLGHSLGERERVIGLELGADDCITKPFGLRELRARVRAVMRRRKYTAKDPLQPKKPRRFRFGGWRLDRVTRRLTNPAGAPVELTNGEFAILLAFLEAPQRPLTREYLLQATRVHEDVFDRSIDVQILRLRRKLETVPTSPRIILTERGIGYTFALPVEQEGN